MHALSCSQPWLWAIELFASDPDGKGIENRKWAPPIHMIDQRIAFHAAKSWDEDGVRFFFDRFRDRPDIIDRMPGARRSYATSAITCTAIINRVVTEDRTLSESQKRWFFGPFGWVLRDVHVLPCPVPCDGKLGLWLMPTALEMAVVSQGAAR